MTHRLRPGVYEDMLTAALEAEIETPRVAGLLVNGRRDVQIASELARKIPSADRIDLMCVFVRHSGLRLFRSELEAPVGAGAQVRVYQTGKVVAG